MNKAAPLVTVTYRNRRIGPSAVAQNPVNPIMTDNRDVSNMQAADDNVVNDSKRSLSLSSTTRVIITITRSMN